MNDQERVDRCGNDGHGDRLTYKLSTNQLQQVAGGGCFGGGGSNPNPFAQQPSTMWIKSGGDVSITDVNMPNMDGITLIKELRTLPAKNLP